jgi:hypothetical protein
MVVAKIHVHFDYNLKTFSYDTFLQQATFFLTVRRLRDERMHKSLPTPLYKAQNFLVNMLKIKIIWIWADPLIFIEGINFLHVLCR